MSWPKVPLADIATIDRFGINPAEIEADTAYLGLEHIARGGEILGVQAAGQAALESTKFRFTREHVLFGKLRPNLGKVALPDFDGICSTDILPIRPGPKVDRSYLRYYLAQPSMVDFAASRAAGVHLPRLSPSVLATFSIPLPPLDEQRRIVAILDRADALRAKCRRALAHLDDLTQSIFDRNTCRATRPLVSLRDAGWIFLGGHRAGRGSKGVCSARSSGALLADNTSVSARGGTDGHDHRNGPTQPFGHDRGRRQAVVRRTSVDGFATVRVLAHSVRELLPGQAQVRR